MVFALEIVRLPVLDPVQTVKRHNPHSLAEIHEYLGLEACFAAAKSELVLSKATYSRHSEVLTFMASKSSSSSCEDAPLIFGAAGIPSYLAMPERMETSLLYAIA